MCEGMFAADPEEVELWHGGGWLYISRVRRVWNMFHWRLDSGQQNNGRNVFTWFQRARLQVGATSPQAPDSHLRVPRDRLWRHPGEAASAQVSPNSNRPTLYNEAPAAWLFTTISHRLEGTAGAASRMES